MQGYFISNRVDLVLIDNIVILFVLKQTFLHIRHFSLTMLTLFTLDF